MKKLLFKGGANLLFRVFDRYIEVFESEASNVYNYVSLLLDSLENEFVIDMSRAPYIDLTSIYFDHRRFDISDIIMSLAVVPLGADMLARLETVAYDVTTRDLQTCEGVYYPNFRMFKLHQFVVDAMRSELLRVKFDLIAHFPNEIEV